VKQGKLGPLLLPTLALVIVGIAALVAIFYAEGLVREADARLVDEARQASFARQKHANAGLEKDTLLRFRETYDRLQSIGFVGTEQRINWVDSLRAVNRDAKLFGVEYQIGQQETFAGASALGAADVPMRQSVMHVRMPLLHEGDLMPFVRRLAEQRVGVFTMNACELTRLPPVQGDPSRPTVSADCELAWITVLEAEPEARKP
jgi:hypothetical protein